MRLTEEQQHIAEALGLRLARAAPHKRIVPFKSQEHDPYTSEQRKQQHDPYANIRD